MRLSSLGGRPYITSSRRGGGGVKDLMTSDDEGEGGFMDVMTSSMFFASVHHTCLVLVSIWNYVGIDKYPVVNVNNTPVVAHR